MFPRSIFMAGLMLQLLGCAEIPAPDNLLESKPDAASRRDAGALDAGGTAVDGGAGDGSAAKVVPAGDLTPGARRVGGGTMMMDVQVGFGISQVKVSNGNLTVEGNAAVKK